jgi:hypothetical protein
VHVIRRENPIQKSRKRRSVLSHLKDNRRQKCL